MRRNWGPFLVTALAVVVGTAFMTAALSLRSAVNDALRSGVSADLVYDLYATGKTETAADGADSLLPVALAKQIEDTPVAAKALPLWSGRGTLSTPDGQLVETKGAPVVYGPTLDGPHGPRWTEGGPPSDANEIALEAAGAKLAGLNTGDEVVADLGSRQWPVTVSGIYTFSAPIPNAVGVALSVPMSQTIASEAGAVPAVAITLDAGVDPTAARELLTDRVGAEANVITRAEYAANLQAGVAGPLDAAALSLLAFFALALLFSVYLIYNRVQMATNASLPEYAQLRRAGATGNQIFGLVIAQGALVGALGGIVGVGLGWLTNRAAEYGLGELGLAAPNGIPMPPGAWVTALLIGVLVTVGASFGPAQFASEVPIVSSTHPVHAATAQPVYGRSRAVIGLVVLLAGAALTVVGALRIPGAPAWYLAGGLFLLTVGILIALPKLMVLTTAAIRAFGRGVPALLASREVEDHPRRTAPTVASLLVGVAVVSAGLTLVSSSDASQKSLVTSQVSANLVAMPSSPYLSLPEGALPALQEATGTQKAAGTQQATGTQKAETHLAPVALGPAVVTVARTQYPVTALALAPDFYGTVVDFPLVEGEHPSSPAEVLLDQTLAQSWGVTVGDQVGVMDEGAPKSVRVTGTIDKTFAGASLITTTTGLLNLAVARNPAYILISVDPAAKATALAGLREAVAPLNTVKVAPADSLVSFEAGHSQRITMGLYVLFALTIIAAVTVASNGLALSVAQQRRQLALLRTLGVSQRQLRRTVYIEAAAASLSGVLLGLLLGVGGAGAIQTFLVPDGMSLFAVPWLPLLGILVVTPVLVVLGTVVPALRASRVPVAALAQSQRAHYSAV